MWSSGCAARQNTCTLAYGTFHVVEVQLDRRTFGNLCPFGIGSLQFEVPGNTANSPRQNMGKPPFTFFFKYDCHDFTFWLLFVRKCFSPRLCEFFALRFGRGHRESRTFPFQPCGNQIFLHVCEVVADRFSSASSAMTNPSFMRHSGIPSSFAFAEMRLARSFLAFSAFRVSLSALMAL